MTSIVPTRVSLTSDHHPMSIVAYLLVLFVIPSLGLAVTFFAQDQAVAGVATSVVFLLSLIGAAATYSTMARRLEHSPLIPDASTAEKARYLAEYSH